MPVINKKNNPDIEKERQTATFDVEEFAIWWNDGPDKLKEKREIENIIYSDPELEDDVPITYLSYQDMYDRTIQKSFILAKKLQKIQEEQNPGGTDIFPTQMATNINSGLNPQGTPLIVHQSMFVPTIQNQGTPEQIQKWIPRALKCNIIGTYAQTELGHGTFLRGLETRADYDSKTEEFVLHSPSITAYKWWPGGLGHTANYGVVAAQLYIDGKSCGIQMFVVQLRDEETHMPLPGIIIGDIGNKMNFQTVNNGYLGFVKHRIPRTNMLMKNAQVQPDGTFKQSPASVLTYFTMVQIRVWLVTTAHMALSRAATITTRYSAVRRQGLINPGEPEQQIIEHVTQQMKVFPQLARTVTIKVNADHLTAMLQEVQKELLNGRLERLPEMHALASCLKAVITKDTAAGIETLRLACGGHGYTLASNMPLIYSSYSASITYEGEYTVLLLQTARYLMKAWKIALNGDHLVPTVAYLGDVVKTKEFGKWDGSWQCIVKAMQYVAANKIRIAYGHLEERKKKYTPEEAANMTAIEMASAAEMHARYFLAKTVMEQVQILNVSEKLKSVLFDLLELYLVDVALDKMGEILRVVNVSEDDLMALQARLENALAKIRPNALAIVDGYDIHDRLVNSVLGSYDGNVYERIFESAQKSPMNKVPVQKSFEAYMKPFMRSNL